MSKVYSAALVGLSAEVVEIEADVLSGLPATVIVGLPDTSVQEARERVKFAIKNSGAMYPRSRVAVNLAPADLPKNGSHYDLPIALSILLNSEQIRFNSAEAIILGELALDGAVRSAPGILPITLMAKEKGFKKILVPAANKTEAALVDGIEVIPIESLIQASGYLQGLVKIERTPGVDWSKLFEQPREFLDFKFIQGQEGVKRALEVAAAGGHNILLSGPPGTGKTLLAKALPSILPQMTIDEALELTKIYSVTGMLGPSRSIIASRPFRSPHHSASAASLVGGGSNPKPGEISLAHRGVLFLDELPEFPRMVLENLRQPLEDGIVTVTRITGTATFPAQFILVAAQNPCPCGNLNNLLNQCTCTPYQITNYQKRVSGPLLDRIDIFMEVARVEYDKLASGEASEKSETIQKRVQKARDIQLTRFKNLKLMTNSEMGVKELKVFCPLGQSEKEFMKKAALKLNLSARAYHRVIKLARTVADLGASESITIKHLAEAIQYRTKSE
jgi:magnesium chelatase family protein